MMALTRSMVPNMIAMMAKILTPICRGWHQQHLSRRGSIFKADVVDYFVLFIYFLSIFFSKSGTRFASYSILSRSLVFYVEHR